MARNIELVFASFTILCIIEIGLKAALTVSHYHLLDNSNLSSSFVSASLIRVIDLTSINQRTNFDYKRLCLSQCNQEQTCLLVSYDSNSFLCTLFDSGPNINDIYNGLPNVAYIKNYYKERSAVYCTSDQFYDNYSCVRKTGYLTSCNFSTACQDSFNLTCISNVCQCAADSYYNSTTCVKKKTYGISCNETIPCDDTKAFVCMSEICGCGNGYYYNGTFCAAQKGLGESCSASYECSTSQMLSCIGNICAVNSSNAPSCGSGCSSGLMCQSGYCLCSDISQVFNGSTCVSLTVVRLSNQDTGTTSYTISYNSGGSAKQSTGIILASTFWLQALPVDANSILVTIKYKGLTSLSYTTLGSQYVATQIKTCFSILSNTFTTSTTTSTGTC